MVNHDRNDGGQAYGSRLGDQKRVPDSHEITQQPKRHEGIARALMLEKDVEVRLAAVTMDREEQVGMPLAEPLIDEARQYLNNASCGLDT